ncbi:group 3 secretory phospholipase A2 [Danio rerio]|uniref:Group 3 secretory phospholipase A2 n=1 Tax=Danio rerio TaxID=7955 RepID=E7F718_DANRE|nr:group 3 secretory phospholipase A2-like [Danio rerio]|eukprot:XP_005169114.1 group 3 secretory phospholipase A2-like [Danio rerio]
MSLQDAGLRSLILIFNLVVFSCCDASTFNKPAPFCLLMKTENSSSQVSFLIRSQDASLLFYWSKWTPDQRVKECFISRDVSQIQRYLSFCHEERIIWDSDGKFSRYNLTALLEDDGLCQINLNINSSLTLREENAKQNQQMDSRVKIRSKRAWVLPGTLWCGRGTNANDYEQLGMFEHADRCCREHDHCEHIIRSFSVNFGVFNPTFFTVSHCDCDHRFKQCLLGGNDTISNMVGYSFFNVLKIRCFEFIQRRQCTQYNWLGLCTMVKLAPVAIMKDSTPYNSTNQTNETSATFDLSCNKVPIKLTHSGEPKTSKRERSRLRKKQKICYKKEKKFQSQNQVNQFKELKNLHRNKHKKGRNRVQLNSLSTFTLAPQRKTPKKMNMRRQKLKMETTVQKTPKASGSALTSEKTKSTISQSKQMQASKSGAKTLRNKRKRAESKIKKSKNREEKHHRNQKQEHNKI